jgi:hypothetical protein
MMMMVEAGSAHWYVGNDQFEAEEKSWGRKGLEE